MSNRLPDYIDSFEVVGVRAKQPVSKAKITAAQKQNKEQPRKVKYKYQRVCTVCNESFETNVHNKKYHAACKRVKDSEREKARVRKLKEQSEAETKKQRKLKESSIDS